MSNPLVNPEKVKRQSCWSNLVRHYEKRNASLERRHEALAERVRMMELALPSVLMGVAVNINPLMDDKVASGVGKTGCEPPVSGEVSCLQGRRCKKVDGNSESSGDNQQRKLQ